MDRASDFGSDGWGFESLRARNVSEPAMNESKKNPAVSDEEAWIRAKVREEEENGPFLPTGSAGGSGASERERARREREELLLRRIFAVRDAEEAFDRARKELAEIDPRFRHARDISDRRGVPWGIVRWPEGSEEFTSRTAYARLPAGTLSLGRTLLREESCHLVDLGPGDEIGTEDSHISGLVSAGDATILLDREPGYGLTATLVTSSLRDDEGMEGFIGEERARYAAEQKG